MLCPCRRTLPILLLMLFLASCAGARPTPVGLGTLTLDSGDPKAEPYLNQVRLKIRAKWVYPRRAGERGIEGELLIEFHIAKDGRLEFIALRNSSGVTILDDYALNAVRLAQPFSPVPDGVAKEPLRITGTFRYQLEKK